MGRDLGVLRPYLRALWCGISLLPTGCQTTYNRSVADVQDNTDYPQKSSAQALNSVTTSTQLAGPHGVLLSRCMAYRACRSKPE